MSTACCWAMAHVEDTAQLVLVALVRADGAMWQREIVRALPTSVGFGAVDDALRLLSTTNRARFVEGRGWIATGKGA